MMMRGMNTHLSTLFPVMISASNDTLTQLLDNQSRTIAQSY
jgi:hypothetical protein